MSIENKNVDRDELFTRLTSTLKQANVCTEMANNPKFPKDQNGVVATLITQYKTLGNLPKTFTTPSYEAEKSRRNRPGG